MVAAVAGAGGSLTGTSFTVSDEREIVAGLERDALKSAIAKARGLIEAAGGRPGRVLAIYDTEHWSEGGAADLARKPPGPEIRFTILPGTTRLTGVTQVIVESLAP
ncbi:SIMPL domain-containing protein [Siculibacillus lacustris]|uniref:SIMPL domain-containing protein n=1 Tax=Siculibacillus lacustris TaxID=1549641 RepID=A0A4Q9VUE9_9HYPH|nr:SIMPL domain-containing protein [Siculibacillus lacustris]